MKLEDSVHSFAGTRSVKDVERSELGKLTGEDGAARRKVRNKIWISPEDGMVY